MQIKRHIFKLLLVSIFLSACGISSVNTEPSQSKQATFADTVYFGGDILTMDGDSPQYVEFLAIKDGKIIYAGEAESGELLVDSSTKKLDLSGNTMLPGFIDAHGHAWNTGVQAMSANILPPPDGDGRDIDTLINLTKEWATNNQKVIDTTGWIIGFGYDDAQLKEGRHPTADDLDRISTTVPVLFLHQSTHLGVMNHKALELAGYTAETPDPAGGVIRRVEGSKEPNGVLEEMALFAPLFSVLAEFDEDANLEIAKAGLRSYAAQGFTTAQEGRATKPIADAWYELSKRGELFLDVDVYPDIRSDESYLKERGTSKIYDNGFRIAGAKLSLDGAIQNYTGYLTKPYHKPQAGFAEDYRGYPAIEDAKEIERLVSTAYNKNWQLIAHANGDAAGDQLINAVEQAVEKYGNEDRRTVMIHAQMIREDQLDAIKRLKIFPSFFAMHTYYWGDLHRSTTIGKERAWRISPAKSALERGMRFSQHHDAPVALPSAMAILSATVNRTSRSGVVIGPEQRVSVYDALRAITIWAAYQGFQENTKGSIEVGKLADFVILDKNPLKIPSEHLREIKVMETIKGGKTVYQAKHVGELKGTAMYRERMALPEGAEFIATLRDVSRADVAAETIAETRVKGPISSPIPFIIPYDPERINPKHRYSVRATITHQGELLFMTDMHHPVFSEDAPEKLNLMLKRVNKNTQQKSTDSKTLSGLYHYTGDTGWIVECSTGERLPVAQEGDNAKLEAAYLDKTVSSDVTLLATVEGRIEQRVPMEGKARPTLIVEKFKSLEQSNCDQASSASLENTYWKIISIQGEPTAVAEKQREPHILLHPADNRVSGHGGCNRLMGTYSVEGKSLSFSRMAGTMMACAEGMEQEQVLHQALNEVKSWTISGQHLKLFDEGNNLLLELESRYLN